VTTYYADFVNGSDANNGLGPDASAATNKPWKTLTKALGATGIASGDTLYLSPAGPFRESVTVAMTSATAETKILGDPGNVQGFKTSDGVAVTPGPIIWTVYTTDDKTAPTTAGNVILAGRDFLTFQYISFIGTTRLIDARTNVSTNIKIFDCAFFIQNPTLGVGSLCVDCQVTTAAAVTWLIDRCIFYGGRDSVIQFSMPTVTGADYDSDITIQNCVFMGGATSINFTTSGALAQKPGGGIVRNCTQMKGDARFVNIATANWSTSIPVTVTNCLMFGNNATIISANVSGQIVEDYNIIVGVTPRSNVTAGTHSIADNSYSVMFHYGQERIWGRSFRRPGEPMIGSPVLGFGNDGTQTSYDGDNNPRPAGGASALPAVGALERSNTWGRETGTVRTGVNALSITGPGYQDFDIPVDAASTTVSVYMRCDSTYAGTKPQIKVLNGDECGVNDATSSAVTTANTWQQLSLTFTPTSKGIITIRLLSSDTNGAGKAFADDFVVS
jgi:hypothetical protein